MNEVLSYICNGVAKNETDIKTLQKAIKRQKNMTVLALGVLAFAVVALKEHIDDQEERIAKMRKDIMTLKEAKYDL